VPSSGSFRELHIHVRKVTDIREYPDLSLACFASNHRLELAVDRELHVTLVVWERWIFRYIHRGFTVRSGEPLQIAWDKLEETAIVADREWPRIPDCKMLLSWFRLSEIHWREQRAVSAVRQLITPRWRDRADILRPIWIAQLGNTARPIEHIVVLEKHVPDRDAIFRNKWQVPVRASYSQ
jgi:hypothetical protein